MIPTTQLFQLCEDEGISVSYRDLESEYGGLYLMSKGFVRPRIVLDRSLTVNERLLRCVLAEELGHHFTGAGNCIVAANHAQRVWIDRMEYLAIKWAVDFLVPVKDLVPEIGRRSLHELADLFYVTREFVEWQASRLQEAITERERLELRQDPRDPAFYF